MAQVQIAVADMQVALEDEDLSAKKVQEIALDVVRELVEIFGVKAPEED